MVIAANLGFPRIGINRELKKAQEAYWKGDSSLAELEATAAELRQRHWELQQKAGIQHIPSNDFSFYDHVLDTIAMVGAIPERYKFTGDEIDLATYFAMARGAQKNGYDVPAMEMTKWFDTNYHYIVPEFSADQQFRLTSRKPLREFNEALGKGITTRPVLLGPITFLQLGKLREEHGSVFDLLPRLLPVYQQILSELAAAGAEWVQIDEPALVLDQDPAAIKAYKLAYETLAAGNTPKIMLTTYFGALEDNLKTAATLPVAGLHLDLVRAPSQLDAALKELPSHMALSLGVIDGRNIWKADLEPALAQIEEAVDTLGSDRVFVAGSSSLLHVPVDLSAETELDDELKSWLAFAGQKLQEISLLARAVNESQDSVEEALKANREDARARRSSPRIHNPQVKQRAGAVTPDMAKRASPYATRATKQGERFNLPLYPTTTIGSFPQTREVRAKRAAFKKGELTQEQYDAFLQQATEHCVRVQEELDIDVLVHGEFERNDMVEYFGEQLSGFAFTRNGWVQSYGSRCVKPPVIFGDVSRPEPMTVGWSSFAQKLTKRPMKGMLTGPVTILQWSFVRDDQPRSDTCRQIALAIRDEVVDLEKAGIGMIQIDEPALREGLPLRKKDWNGYLGWAVEAFRLSAAGVKDETQIHTHMCYSEFNDIIASIAALDADVISIETSRSQMELLDAFVDFKYPNEIGPGVYDIHSPRVPTVDEMVSLLRKASKVLAATQIWVNPDCGLKTRGWEEVTTALRSMVTAAKTLREESEAPAERKSA